ncbi:MAG: HAD family hydrolase [bacterium]
MFIIDLDDTLFNTRGVHGFKEVRLSVLNKLGVTEDLYDKTYSEARNQEPIGYNNIKHAQVLSKHGFDQEEVFQALEKTISSEILKTFLFSDSLSFLGQMKSLGEPMILLSFGDTDFQTLKAKGSGFEEYFDRFILTRTDKSDVVAELANGKNLSKIWFINNRPDETLNVKKNHPKINYILKKSEDIDEQEYIKSQLPYFKTLNEIYEYIRDNR